MTDESVQLSPGADDVGSVESLPELEGSSVTVEALGLGTELLEQLQASHEAVAELDLSPQQVQTVRDLRATTSTWAIVHLENLVAHFAAMVTPVAADLTKEKMNAGQLRTLIDILLEDPEVKKDEKATDALKAADGQLGSLDDDSQNVDAGTRKLIDLAFRRVQIEQSLVIAADLIEWALEFLPSPTGWLEKILKLWLLRKALKGSKTAKAAAAIEKIDKLIAKIGKLKKLKKGWDKTQEGKDLTEELDKAIDEAENALPEE